MKGQLNVATPKEYIAALEEPRRSDIAQLDQLIRRTAPQLESKIGSGMLGYGPYHYRYPTGREGDSFRIGVASNASYISLYAMAADDQGYIAERFKTRLPKASIGKSCVRFKRLADLDLTALAELIQLTATTAFPEGRVTETPAPKGGKPVAKAKANAAVKKGKSAVKAKANAAVKKGKSAVKAATAARSAPKKAAKPMNKKSSAKRVSR